MWIILLGKRNRQHAMGWLKYEVQMNGVEIEVREEIWRGTAKTKGSLSVSKKPNTVEANTHMQAHTYVHKCTYTYMCVWKKSKYNYK